MRSIWQVSIEPVCPGWSWVVMVAVTAVLAACSGDVPEARDPVVDEMSHAAAPTDTVEGLLRVGENGLTFQECDSAVESWVVEAEGADLREAAAGLSVDAGSPVLARFVGAVIDPQADGPGSEYQRAVFVTRWVFVAEDTGACRVMKGTSPDRETERTGEGALPSLADGVLLRALGNEPFWNVEIRSDRARVTRLGFEDLEFFIGTSKPRGTTRRWTGQSGEHRFELSVEERSCADTMVDRTYRLEALLTLDGQQFRGCAYEAVDGAAVGSE